MTPTQRDPLGSGNSYAYTSNNPANYADPSGLVTQSYFPIDGIYGPATQCAYTFSSAETTAIGDDLIAGNTGAGVIGGALAYLGIAVPPVAAILVGLGGLTGVFLHFLGRVGGTLTITCTDEGLNGLYCGR